MKRLVDASHVTLPEQSKPHAKKPRLTGTYIRPTLFNPPMPRLKPQPIKTSMMIHKRILARDNRRVQHALHMQNIRDMSQELKFWKGLGIPVGSIQEEKQWCELSQPFAGQELYVDRPSPSVVHHKEYLNASKQCFDRAAKRSASQFSPNIIKRVEAARKRKTQSLQRSAAQRKVGAALEGTANLEVTKRPRRSGSPDSQ